MPVTLFSFGSLSDGTPVPAARIETSAGAAVTVIGYGAAIQSIRVPDKSGTPVEVALGFDTAAEYETGRGHLGAVIGRVANRLGGAEFCLNETRYRLVKNSGENHIHGGVRGFDKFVWTMTAQDDAVVCERLSLDGEEGYPGNLRIRITYRLTEDNALHIVYDADTDADTLVNLTNHSYFNLNGGGDAMAHSVQIFAERFCENDENGLPTGTLLDVAGTPFDFRTPKAAGADIAAEHAQLRRGNGYDHNYCLAGRRAAVVRGEQSGIVMTVETDLPGMQFYSANGLRVQPGHGGAMMGPRQALCFETQLWPNALRCYGFPSPVLRREQHLHSETVYAFSLA
ncbi:MAG: galactose mutarotase [Oscillospiraceae bacterium]|nr:galactose mutarotase [Oscillospiraceae bacterium]